MTILVTGSSGHLGEALVRTLRERGTDHFGVDLVDGAFTTRTGDLADRGFVRDVVERHRISAVLHAATLHKPHVGVHTRQRFVDTNVTATLNLLEETEGPLVFTSTTSAFGRALVDTEETTWITEDVVPVPKNIYGATKTAAEDLCQLVHQDHGRPCVVLRTSRFFPEEDDDAARRSRFSPDNLKVLELLHRRVDLDDVVAAHLLALERAEAIGFAKLIVSATTPFTEAHRPRLKRDAAGVLRELFPALDERFERRGWTVYDSVDRVYDNSRARRVLGWRPRYDFGHALECLAADRPFTSELARAVGSKGYGV